MWKHGEYVHFLIEGLAWQGWPLAVYRFVFLAFKAFEGLGSLSGVRASASICAYRSTVAKC